MMLIFMVIATSEIELQMLENTAKKCQTAKPKSHWQIDDF